MTLRFLCLVALLTTTIPARSAEPLHFETRTLSERFYSEGADAGDMDGDGVLDIVSGPFYFRGPSFNQRVRYRAGESFAIAGYSDQFFTFVDDIDSDGDQDVLVVPIPGIAAHWFENPRVSAKKTTAEFWAKHLVIDKVDGESPTWLDVDGDGQSELVCIYGGCLGYARPTKNPRQPWSFVRISPSRNYGRFTHGLGVGDVDGDGRQDYLETNGWWRQPDDYEPGDLFEFHEQRFAQSGGAQMFAVDVDGDGDNDVVSSQNAHGFGLGWFEQSSDLGDLKFTYHEIMGSDPASGMAISQLHAVAMADMDRDGRLDIVTGKRFWAHGGRDPDASNDPVTYWFRNTQVDGKVTFHAQLINGRAGVGTQLVIEDVDGDDDADVIVGNKLGTFVMLQQSGKPRGSEEPLVSDKTPGVAPGSAAFALPVRSTEPLTPADEQKTFRLPAGFEIQLVAAEPDISKPLNLAFDVRGRLWVTNSLEYPYAAPVDGELRDSIKVFEDTNGDGSFDKVTTFADKLNVPIGLYPYGDGVICFSVPHIWYLRDTDGDGKCDRRQKLYGPMGYERDTHGLCNAFRRGYDGWLHACHGFNNHTTVKGRDGHEITMQSGNTFRMRLDGERIEQYTWGQVNPFGMMIDERGEILTADCHTKPVTLLIPKGHYESFGKPHDGLGFVPAVMNHLHGSTAIAGIAPMDAQTMPADYRNTTLGGNVMTSRINRNTLVYTGSTVQAREEPDFLVSGDPWFRPVDVRLGPDGAIYVADFYNRIIGHYEVPLDHPGRDRHRGRIWRITYKGAEKSTPASLSSSRLDRLTVEQLFAAMSSANATKQRMIVNYLCDEHASKRTSELAQSLLEDAAQPEAVRVAAVWVLARNSVLRTDMLAEVWGNASSSLRGHLMHVARHSSDRLDGDIGQLVAQGLRDDDALVRRFAAQASSFVTTAPVDKLLLAYNKPSDPHLKHTLKIAIREQLRDKAIFEKMVAEKNQLNEAALIDIALALDHDAAADYIVAALPRKLASWTEKQRQDYIRHAASHAGTERLAELAAVVKASMNLGQQRELLLVIRDGLATRGTPPPAAVRDWAEELAAELLRRSSNSKEPLTWQYAALPGTRDRGNPFVKQTRSSADKRDAAYFCTLPSGEQRTGVYRSAAFEVSDTFRFFTAGHIGPPNKPVVARSFIRLREAESHQILYESTPPRNDIAQPIEWNTSSHNGKRVYVEIVDGDTRGAYAWLAVGRFSESRLNPSNASEDRRRAAELFGAFRLQKLRLEFENLLRNEAGDPATDRAVLVALGQLAHSTRMSACGEALSLPARNDAFRKLVVEAAFSGDKAMDKALETAMLSATAVTQTRLAKQLVSDQSGSQLLMTMIENGKASATLLLDPAVLERLKVVDGGSLKERVETATLTVQAQAALEQQQHIGTRLQAYLTAPGNVTKGQAMFKKQCSQCHQAAGVGAKIAPQLDGIRSRGVARLVEDIVAPNRNVDVAFRTTTIATTDGLVIIGVIRSEDNGRLILVDQEGKERIIAVDDIDEKVPSRSSLMPANVLELVKGDDWNDLIAFLLSLE